MTTEEIALSEERLRELQALLGADKFAGFTRTLNLPVADARSLVTELLALREAVKPFADYGRTFLPSDATDKSIWATASDQHKISNLPVTIGDFRRAARALSHNPEPMK